MAMSGDNRAVFLDKDGTLVENVPYNVDPERMALAPGAAEAVGRLAEHGYRILVVSNQPGVALGYFALTDLRGVEQRLDQLLPALDGFYFCPHAPEAGCSCRKPACGMLMRAAQEHAIDLRSSWMVGDILDDIEAGRRAGCRTVLVDNGNETEWDLSAARRPHGRVAGLAEAASLICGTR
jgi:D-glycero-D-manno-heptose 1,7-bisphosphate phosphatase